jgi:hypothetical protein
MRDVMALIVILLVIMGILFVWRHSVLQRRRNSHSLRFRLVGGADDQGMGR